MSQHTPLSPPKTHHPSQPYIPDPVLQHLDPLPQPYRMLSNMVDSLFSDIFESITKAEKRKERLSGNAPTADPHNEQNTAHVKITHTRPSSLKLQKNVFSSEKMHIDEGVVCVGVTKAPQTRDSIQVASSERWIVTSQEEKNIYVLRRNKVLWNARDYFARMNKGEGGKPDTVAAAENVDWSNVRCVSELISVFAGVVHEDSAPNQPSLKIWIYHENESDSSHINATEYDNCVGPQLNLLSHIKPDITQLGLDPTSYSIGNVLLSEDGRYVCVEFSGMTSASQEGQESNSSTTHIAQLFKLPSYKKFVGEPLPITQSTTKRSTGPTSVVSGASSSRKSAGGRRIPASSTGGKSAHHSRNGPGTTSSSLKPAVQMAMWDTDRFQEPQLLLQLSSNTSLTTSQPPQIAFLSNDYLVKHVTTTNSVYRLYNENTIRKSHTKSLLVWWKGSNVLKLYDLERYYHDTKSALDASHCNQFTFVDGITTVGVSDESDYFAVGLANGNVILFDTKSGSSIYLPESHEAMVSSLTFTSFGELISGSIDGDVRVFSIDAVDSGEADALESSFEKSLTTSLHSTPSHLITRIQAYTNAEPPQKIINLTASRETNLFWCCTNKHVDIIDVNGSFLCTIPLKNLNCFNYFGSGHTFICSSDCLMKEKHGFFVFEMLDAILLAYPEIENQFPAVHNSESAAREVYEFVRCTPHSLRNDSETINAFLSSPSSLLSPLLMRQHLSRAQRNAPTTSVLQSAATSRATTGVGGKRPKSKGVSFGAPSEGDSTSYISLASLSRKNPNQMENPIQRGTLRVEQSKRLRRKRARQRQQQEGGGTGVR